MRIVALPGSKEQEYFSCQIGSVVFLARWAKFSLVRRPLVRNQGLLVPGSPFTISDTLPQPARRADGKPAIAADVPAGNALVAWVRYGTPEMLILDGVTDLPEAQANPPPGGRLSGPIGERRLTGNRGQAPILRNSEQLVALGLPGFEQYLASLNLQRSQRKPPAAGQGKPPRSAAARATTNAAGQYQRGSIGTAQPIITATQITAAKIMRRRGMAP